MLRRHRELHLSRRAFSHALGACKAMHGIFLEPLYPRMGRHRAGDLTHFNIGAAGKPASRGGGYPGGGPPEPSVKTTRSTRLFWARPSGVVFSATGRYWLYPAAASRKGSY